MTSLNEKLLAAVKEGTHLNIVKALLDEGADPLEPVGAKSKPALFEAVIARNKPMVDLLMTSEKVTFARHDLVTYNGKTLFDYAKACIGQAKKSHSTTNIAMSDAIARGLKIDLEALLRQEREAKSAQAGEGGRSATAVMVPDNDPQRGICGEIQRRDITALYARAARNEFDPVTLLSGWSPLEFAAHGGGKNAQSDTQEYFIEIIVLLFSEAEKQGIDLAKVENKRGNPALGRAIHQQKPAIVKALLEAGITPQPDNKFGAAGSESTIAELVAYYCDPDSTLRPNNPQKEIAELLLPYVQEPAPDVAAGAGTETPAADRIRAMLSRAFGQR